MRLWNLIFLKKLPVQNQSFNFKKERKNFRQKNYDKAIKLAKLAYPSWYVDEVKKDLSDLQDADLAALVTDLKAQLTGLQASQQAFVKISDLNLFNYLK